MILLFGAGGQLGQELTRRAEERGVRMLGLRRAEADIADPGAVARALAETRLKLIVNAAGYTDVDGAEREPEAARQANAAGPAVLAEAAAERGLPLVHLSTDYVFDGVKPGAYTEDDEIAPLGSYGWSKAAGEAAIRQRHARHLILRTSWVYGVYGRNFLKTVLQLARERDELRIVSDQRGSPTATADLAEALLRIAAHLARGAEPWGTFHFAGTGATSWHGFAQRIVEWQAPFTGRRPPVTAITSGQYPTPTRRPANSVLDSSRFAATFGWRARPWQEAAQAVVRQLVAAGVPA